MFDFYNAGYAYPILVDSLGLSAKVIYPDSVFDVRWVPASQLHETQTHKGKSLHLSPKQEQDTAPPPGEADAG